MPQLRTPLPAGPAQRARPMATDLAPERRAATSNDWAAAALRSLRQHGLAVTPQTFSVWYEYHRGGLPELNRLLDILLSNRIALDEEKFADLHARFLGAPQTYLALRGTSQRMQQTIGDVLALLRDASDDASRFGTAVREATGQFVAHQISIESLIRDLLGETQDLAKRTDQIEAELTRNAELMKSLQKTLDDARHEALTDGLTGLANRRHFDETVKTMAGQAMNDGRELALILADIDHFKSINDRWGHPVGDQVLQLVASILRGCLRPADFAARYGGEEFAVLLPATDIADAVALANRLREAFAGRRVVVRETRLPIGVVTISAGVAVYGPGERLAEWLRRVDLALYAAKQGGRNRVVPAEPALNP
jgi:diguanylate cyclase